MRAASALDNRRLFSDEVFTSTDLNRRAGEVLNHARTKPVTISRNNEHFALLRREQVAGLVEAVYQLENAVELFTAALKLKKGDELPSEFAWIKEFDSDDRLAMLVEILSAVVRAKATDDWESVENTIHEWRESATVIQSGVLDAAMKSAPDEKPLPAPGGAEAELSVA